MATVDEIISIIGALKLHFPNFGSRLSDLEWEQMPAAWHQVLHDIPFELLEAAAKNYISVSGSAFAPSDSELRKEALALATNTPSAEEAWGEVRRAMGRYGHMTQPDRIPWSSPLVLRAVRIMDWLSLCMSENEVADRAHFMRIYGTLHEREKRNALMLPEVREVAARLQSGNGRLALPAGED